MSFFLQPFRGEQHLFPQITFPFFSNMLSSHAHTNGSDVSIYEHKNAIVVEAGVPGMNAKDVNVNYEKGILTIQATKKDEKEDREKRFFHKSTSSFVYHLTVPGHIDETAAPKAEILNGLVKVTFAKQKTKEGPKTIAIEGKTSAIQHKAVAKHLLNKPKKKNQRVATSGTSATKQK